VRIQLLIISDKSLILKMERVKGIEPSSSAWKAVALPLSYTRTRSSLQRKIRKPASPTAFARRRVSTVNGFGGSPSARQPKRRRREGWWGR
jgi:hypothetical protein